MADRLPPEHRSNLMRQVKGKDTTPEMIVRRKIHALGYRYSLHAKRLPGKPDVAFVSRRKAVFIHGCFWHGHGCSIGRLPKSRPEFWEPKIARNRARDAENVAALNALGWQTHAIWQCELKQGDMWLQRLVDFLGPSPKSRST